MDKKEISLSDKIVLAGELYTGWTDADVLKVNDVKSAIQKILERIEFEHKEALKLVGGYVPSKVTKISQHIQNIKEIIKQEMGGRLA